MGEHLKLGCLFTEAFADVVEDMRSKKEYREEQQGISKKNRSWSKAAFARRVYGENNSPGSKYNRIINIVTRTGKTQRLPLEEAFAMADAFGYDFSDFAKKVEERMEGNMRNKPSKQDPLANSA